MNTHPHDPSNNSKVCPHCKTDLDVNDIEKNECPECKKDLIEEEEEWRYALNLRT